MQNNSIAVTSKHFPAPAELTNPARLAGVADDLRGLVQIWNDDARAAYAARQSNDPLQHLTVAERIVSRGLPTILAEYPSAIRAQHDAPFDIDQALTSIEFLANTFNGGSPLRRWPPI